MRFGATRKGPCAPSTFQFGKYDVFTRIGVPTWSTSKSIVLVPLEMLLTVAGSTGRTGGVSPSLTRAHDDGPLAEGEFDPSACTVECPRHGSLFDITSGRPKTLPAFQPVEVFAARVEDGDVKLEV